MSKKPDDAARIASLAGILKTSNRTKEIPPSPPLPRDETPAAPATSAARQKDGKIGKYRDPSFKQTGVYIRKETLKRVKRRLEDLEAGKDLSELVEELLGQWLASD